MIWPAFRQRLTANVTAGAPEMASRVFADAIDHHRVVVFRRRVSQSVL